VHGRVALAELDDSVGDDQDLRLIGGQRQTRKEERRRSEAMTPMISKRSFALGRLCGFLAAEETSSMKAMSIALVALASLCLAGCPDEKAKPAPDKAEQKPAEAAPAKAAPAPSAKPAEGGW
jgi:hypothetical protein